MAEVKFCSCGRIHIIDDEKLNSAIENNKEILHVCQGCGATLRIGADPYDDGYALYSIDANSSNIDLERIECIVVSKGIKVPMNNGYYATYHGSCGFLDERSPSNSELKAIIEENNCTFEDSFRIFQNRACSVDMDRFIYENKDSDLEEISGYLVEGLDWKNTKFEREF